jgi:molybdenum cofactor synthesis domain-containing protein
LTPDLPSCVGVVSAGDYPDQMLRASIVVIGDEILGGFVRDTNSGWLAARLHVVGVPLDRIVTVPDQARAIDEALRAELGRARPRVVLTSGGIGSTPDDLTVEAVAASLGLELRVEPEIDARINRALRWTAEQGAEISPEHERAMRKMARVPVGARLLASIGGIAPGIAVDVDGGLDEEGGATVVILPGVPSELKRIVQQGVEPVLLHGRGDPLHVKEIRHGYPESTLSPVLDRLVRDFPDVHVGSYPDRECMIRLKGSRTRVEQATAVVEDYLADLDTDPASARLRAAWGARWQ